MAKTPKTAYETSINMLARQLMSEGDLTAKLTAKKLWSAAEISETIARLKKIGAIRDDLLAENLVSSLRDRGYGPARIRMQLKKHRFSEELSEQAMSVDPVDGEDAAHDDLDDAMRAISQKAPQLRREADSRKRKAKAIRFLQGRGFSLDTAFRAYGRWSAAEGQDDGGEDEWN